MKKLGTHTTGKSYLYIRKLEDVDVATLEERPRTGSRVVSDR
ncbi:MAG: hypothetical protein ACE5GX_03835 [Thermoanaerobaculia bacterium]